MSSAAESHRQAARNWTIVAGLLVLAVVLDLVRDDDGRRKRRR